jgi:hypothetical protein
VPELAATDPAELEEPVVVLVAARAVVLVAEATLPTRTTAIAMSVFFMMLPRKLLKRTRLPDRSGYQLSVSGTA